MKVPSDDAELKDAGLAFITRLSRQQTRRGYTLLNVADQNGIIGHELLEISAIYPQLVHLINNSEHALTGILPGKPKKDPKHLGTRAQAVVDILSGITEPAFRICAIGSLAKAFNTEALFNNAEAISRELKLLPNEALRVRKLISKLDIREPEMSATAGFASEVRRSRSPSAGAASRGK